MHCPCRLSKPQQRFSHWSGYTRGGIHVAHCVTVARNVLIFIDQVPMTSRNIIDQLRVCASWDAAHIVLRAHDESDFTVSGTLLERWQIIIVGEVLGCDLGIEAVHDISLPVPRSWPGECLQVATNFMVVSRKR